MSWFHAKEGWLFRRADEFGAVEIEKRTNDRAQNPEMYVAFDADTWCSIVASVSASGEDGQTFGAAKALHMDELVTTVTKDDGSWREQPDPIRERVEWSIIGAFTEALAERRNDKAFMDRLHRNIEKHKDLLDRLAEDD